jgi:hypothetical protein
MTEERQYRGQVAEKAVFPVAKLISQPSSRQAQFLPHIHFKKT